MKEIKMKIIIIVLIVFILIGGFIFWRYTSVARGTNTVDSRLFTFLDPIEVKLKSKSTIDQSEIIQIARKAEIRSMLYMLLKYYDKIELFPQEYLSQQAQAETNIAYWLMHPNEMGAAPSKIEFIKEIKTDVGKQYYVFRFKVDPPNWATQKGWMLGASGPYASSTETYSSVAGTFSKLEGENSTQPEQLVEWIEEMLKTNNLN